MIPRQPTIPACDPCSGGGGGAGGELLQYTSYSVIDPGRGGGMEEGGGGTHWWWGGWPSSLLALSPAASPAPARGGVPRAEVVPGCASTLQEGRSARHGG
jgi:hypothetical protein